MAGEAVEVALLLLTIALAHAGLGWLVHRATGSIAAGFAAALLAAMAVAAHTFHGMALTFGHVGYEPGPYGRIAREAWLPLLFVYFVAPAFLVTWLQRAWRRAGERA
jgi:hypothetical protein